MDRLTAWLGGAIFVASLAFCGWWYFVDLGDLAGARGGVSAAVRDAALVTIFAGHHSLFARDAIKIRLSRIPAHLLRSVYVWVASILLILTVAWWQPIGGELYTSTGARAAVHVAVQAVGLWLIARAVAGLDPLELAGIRAAAHHATRGPSLQIEGPYRFVRHPLYLGWILLLFGIPHMTGDRLAFAALTTLYLAAAVPLEERSLMQSFGDEYRRYRSRVRWRIIPFVY